MKRKAIFPFLLLWLFLFSFFLSAQSNYTFQYWFNNDLNQVKTKQVSAIVDQPFDINLSAIELPEGLNVLHCRVLNTENKPSGLITTYFVRGYAGVRQTFLEYWFDNDNSQKQQITVTNPDQIIDFSANISNLPVGLHSVHIRTGFDFNTMTSVKSAYFYKLSVSERKPVIEYWFDNNIAQSAKINLTNSDSIVIINALTDNLSVGLHTFHIRTGYGNTTMTSSQSCYFYKLPHIPQSGKIEYWFDNDYANRIIYVNDKPDILRTINIDASALTIGKHKLSVRTGNTNGVQSAIDTAYFQYGDVKVLNIKTLNPDINDLVPGYIKEFGAAYLHYQVTDTLGNPIKGVRIKSFLDNKSEPVISSLSDDKGIVQLKVSVSGKSIEDKNDDLIAAYSSNTLRFNSAIDMMNYELEVKENNFKPRTFAVFPYIPTKKSGTFTASLGKAADYEYISGSVKVGSSFNFTYDFNNLGEIEKLSYESSLKATADTKIDFKIIGAEAGININYLNNTEVKMNDDPRAYILVLYNMLSLDNLFKTSNSLFFMSAIADIIQNDQNPLNLESKSSQKIGIKLNAGFDIKKDFTQSLGGNIKKVIFPLDLNINGSFNYGFNWGKSLNDSYVSEEFIKHDLSVGVKLQSNKSDFGHKIFDDLSNGWRQYDLFSTSKPLNISIEGVRETQFSMSAKKLTGFDKNNNLKLNYGLTNEIDFSIEGIKAKLKNLNFIIHGDVLFSRETTSETSIGEKMLNFLNSSTSNEIPFTLTSLKNVNNESFSLYNTFLDASTMEQFVSKELETRTYKQTENSLKEDCFKVIEKNNECTFMVGLPVKIGVFDFDFEAELAFKNTFPLVESYYHAETKKMFPVVVYSDFDVESEFNDISGIENFWKQIQNSVSELKEVILEKIKNIGHQIVDFVGDKLTVFSNSTRSYTRSLVKYQQFKAAPQQHYSILEFTIPDNQQSFASNTRFEFMYFYTGGEVLGFTQDSDTFLIVSDVFYLIAINGNDTLKTAPNGNFSLKSTLGVEDLTVFDLNPNTPVAVYFKPTYNKLWTKLGEANSSIEVNGLGNYALGIDINADTIPPQITINKEENSKLFTVQISDNIGINWNSVNVTCNGTFRTYSKAEKGLLTITLAEEEYLDELFITVSVKDVAQNINQVNKSFNMLSEIKSTKYSENLKIYPNPFRNKLTFEYSILTSTETKLEIFNTYGQKIKEYKILNSNSITKQEIDLKDLKPGIYFYKSTSGTNIQNGSMIKM